MELKTKSFRIVLKLMHFQASYEKKQHFKILDSEEFIQFSLFYVHFLPLECKFCSCNKTRNVAWLQPKKVLKSFQKICWDSFHERIMIILAKNFWAMLLTFSMKSCLLFLWPDVKPTPTSSCLAALQPTQVSFCMQ